MANFKPLKGYIIYLIDKLIEKYRLEPPFIDIGCGIGDVSHHLAKKDWGGLSIDISPDAIHKTKTLLSNYNLVKVERDDIRDVSGKFNIALLLDVIEHVEDDVELLNHTYEKLNRGGYIILTTPSNKKEWSWDDTFYGHFRRYNSLDIKKKLNSSKYEVIKIWDFTYPLFWLMRRFYVNTFFLSKSEINMTVKDRTILSSGRSAWMFPFAEKIFSWDSNFWDKIYDFHYHKYRKKVSSGHEMIVLARKD